MILSTVCYLEKDECYLMLHRTKKKQDISQGKWLGVGGKFEKGESPEDCLLREVKEETGFTLKAFQLRGIVTYYENESGPDHYMFVFTTKDFEGEMIECDEGELQWIPKNKVLELPTWESDRIFLKRLLENKKEFFTAQCQYQENKLISCQLREY